MRSLNEQAIASLEEEWKEWLMERGYPPFSLGQVNEDEVGWSFRNGDDINLIPEEGKFKNPNFMLPDVLAGTVRSSVGASIVQPNPLTQEERESWVKAIRSGASRAAAPIPSIKDDQRPKGALRRD